MSESRKAFEVWAKLAFPHMSLLKKGDTDKYVYKTANFACEAFCEGEAWQASRQALEGEPTAIVNDSGVLEWYPPYNRPPAGTKLYTHPASAEVERLQSRVAEKCDAPVGWIAPDKYRAACESKMKFFKTIKELREQNEKLQARVAELESDEQEMSGDNNV